jgi:hypothetical protein
MNQSNIDRLIPVVIDYFSKIKNEVVKEGSVESELAGYLSSLGPTIRQANMIKAFAIYTETVTGSKRYLIADLVKEILIKGNIIDQKYEEENLLDIFIDLTKGKDDLERMNIEDRFIEVIIACKICLNLYNIVKKRKGRN